MFDLLYGPFISLFFLCYRPVVTGNGFRIPLDLLWIRSLLRVWVLIFEIYQIRVGSESKKYLTGSGSDPKVAPETSVFTYAFRQVYGF